MKIVRAKHMDALRQFLCLPDIWENIAGKNVSQDNFYPQNTHECLWLLVIDNDETIGVIFLHHDNSFTLKMHPYMLKSHKMLAKKMMKKFYEWFDETMPEQIIKLIVSIPTSRKPLINFAKNVGFEMEGNNRQSYIDDGIIYDQINMGIARKKMTEVIA